MSIGSFLICHPEAARRSKATERNEGPRACVRQRNVSGNSHCAPGIVFARQADDSKLIRTTQARTPWERRSKSNEGKLLTLEDFPCNSLLLIDLDAVVCATPLFS